MVKLRELPQTLAIEMVKKVMEKARVTKGDPVAITVVDITGTVKAALRMDGAIPQAAEISRRKAFTAFMTYTNTKEWEKSGIDPADFGDPKDITSFGGGVVLRVKDEIFGAIGVSGRKSCKERESDPEFQDHELALLALETINKQFLERR